MLNCFKSVLNALGASELGLQYPNDVNNDVMLDYINSNYIMEVEKKPYSCLIYNFLGLTAKKMQISIDHRVRSIVPRSLSYLPMMCRLC
ncbi:hypothetical protein HN011_011456 [Eciton burchellii]|nr:hypothetical protein HN011_011456 [Eciton burchellii]